MRIAHVTLDGGFPRYGIGLAVRSLADAQARAGDDVVVCVREGNAPTASSDPGAAHIVPLRRRSGLLGGKLAYRRQIRAALAPSVDVVHVHTLVRVAHWLLPPRSRRHAPLVVTAHASDELGPSASPSGDASPARASRHAKQARTVLRLADAVIAPSRFMAGLVRRASGRDEVDVIAHGPTDERAAARTGTSEFVIAALSRIVVVKGLDLLVEAFAAAFADDESARLVVAGDGPERDALAALAARLHVLDRVNFPGYLEGDARAALLARTAVVAVPTRGDYETFGLAALDGLAAGCDVLVAAGGALPERVEGAVSQPGPVGRIVHEETPDAWARALAEGRARFDARPHAGSPARLFVENSWLESAVLHRAVYQRLRTFRRAGGI